MSMVRSRPSSMPRFLAAIEGWLIHFCKRCTDSSWRLSISFWIAVKSGLELVCSAGEFWEKASAAAPAAAAWSNVRRVHAFGSRLEKEVAPLHAVHLAAGDLAKDGNHVVMRFAFSWIGALITLCNRRQINRSRLLKHKKFTGRRRIKKAGRDPG